jgi:hypothetical protein
VVRMFALLTTRIKEKPVGSWGIRGHHRNLASSSMILIRQR